MKSNAKHRALCEPLETRTLLSTYVINGTSGGDLWHIEARPGQVFVGGVTINNASITDVQVNGFNGDDLLVINHASIPVVFNAGEGDNWLSLTSGIMSGQITAPLTFNAGAGNDFAELRDEISPFFGGYDFYGDDVIAWNGGAGSLDLNLGGWTTGDRVKLNASPFGSVTNFHPNSWNGKNTTITGGAGGDLLLVDYSALHSSLFFDGRAGTDSVSIDDSDRITDGFHSYFAEATATRYEGQPAVSYNSTLESVILAGSATTNGNYFPRTTGPTALTLVGGNAHDSFWFPGTINGPVTIDSGAGNDQFSFNFSFNWTRDQFGVETKYPINVDGGTGFNYLNVDNFNSGLGEEATSYDIRPSNIRTRGFGSLHGLDFNYDNMSQANIYCGDQVDTVNVYGTSSDIPYYDQMTILCNGSDDQIKLYPHDAQGNLTINGNLGIGGGAGFDNLLVDDSASSVPITYTIQNTFGAGTQNIYGIGAAGFGTGSVEGINISASSGNDTFNINQFLSGANLAIDARGGDDVCNFGNGNLPANIAPLAAFTFNGQGGTDTLNLLNTVPADPFTYRSDFGMISVIGAAYELTVYENVTERVFIRAGGGNDFFRTNVVVPGTSLDLFGGAGLDHLIIGSALNSAAQILGPINFDTGANFGRVTVIDSSSIDPKVLHLEANALGAFPGDNLFGSGGSLRFTTLATGTTVDAMTIQLGSGADSIYAQPLATGTVNIVANNPTTSPGDTLNLALASAQNYVITPGSSGNLTSSNLATLRWSGIEQPIGQDAVAPAFTSGNLNLNGIPVGGRTTLRRQSIDVQFSENVSALIGPQSLDLYNSDTLQHIPSTKIAVQYDHATNIAHFTFPGYTNGVLPDGDYEGRIVGALPDLFGNAMLATAPFNFFVLAGDANHDRKVDIGDLGILASNWQGPGKTFSQGDFDYSGSVDVNDLGILASHWQQNLAAPSAPSVRSSSRIIDQVTL